MNTAQQIEEIRTTYKNLNAFEQVLLKLLAQGYKCPEIGKKLIKSDDTIKGYVKDLYVTIGCHSRTGATHFAIIADVLTPEEKIAAIYK